MNLKNCKKCGRMFNYISGMPICPQCRESAEATFQTVKKFVQENKQATIPEIVENCKVDSKQIQQWIREERLFFADDSPVKINCEICGTQISTGRYCEKCKKETMNGLNVAGKRPEAPTVEMKKDPTNPRMYTFQK